MPKNIPKILFIGGAPRSGTTLLCNLLDGHSGVLMFPTEHSTIENFFRHRDEIESYARCEFINERQGGQQTFLSNKQLYEKNQKHLQQQFGKTFPMSVDHQAFRSAYSEFLTNRVASLENMLMALASGLTNANDFVGQTAMSERRSIAFKQPLYTEIFAQQTALELQNAYFIHIIRDPYARYLSARIRKQTLAKKLGRRLGPINRMPYVEGHLAIDLISRKLAKENFKALGEARYRIVSFENLIEFPSQTLTDILSWLGLTLEQSNMLPTRLGVPTDSGSTQSKGFSIDSSSIQRIDKYRDFTSWNERQIHEAFLALYMEEKKIWRLPLVSALLMPLPNSNLKNYLCQLNSIVAWLTKKEPFSISCLIEQAKLGNLEISGST